MVGVEDNHFLTKGRLFHPPHSSTLLKELSRNHGDLILIKQTGPKGADKR